MMHRSMSFMIEFLSVSSAITLSCSHGSCVNLNLPAKGFHANGELTEEDRSHSIRGKQ
jgi:hypothetical protein